MGELQQLISFSPQAVFSIKKKWHYLKQLRGDNLEDRETALSLGHALKVDVVKKYKENQDQMVAGIMERLLTT